MYAPLTDYEEYLANQVVDIAVKIHKTLGPAYWKVYMKHAFFMSYLVEIFIVKGKKRFQLFLNH